MVMDMDTTACTFWCFSGTFTRYAKVRNRRGLTGAQVAEQMMHNAGIYDVSVQRVAGNLTDHYDPRTKTLRLSESVYDSTSVAAVGVAAHETGHAIQHDVGYAPLALRSFFVPLANFGSRLAIPLILIGFIFSGGGSTLVTLGILFFSLSVVFTIITLPVDSTHPEGRFACWQMTGFWTATKSAARKRC